MLKPPPTPDRVKETEKKGTTSEHHSQSKQKGTRARPAPNTSTSQCQTLGEGSYPAERHRGQRRHRRQEVMYLRVHPLTSLIIPTHTYAGPTSRPLTGLHVRHVQYRNLRQGLTQWERIIAEDLRCLTTTLTHRLLYIDCWTRFDYLPLKETTFVKRASDVNSGP